jgi:hypothetical protein
LKIYRLKTNNKVVLKEMSYLQKSLNTIRQYAFPRTRALESELSAVRLENESVTRELEEVRSEFETARDSDAQQISSLRQQISHIESDRTLVRQQTEVLKRSLEEATFHQKSTDENIRLLNEKLEKERDQHEAGLSMSREALTRLQAEQQKLLSLQSEMATTFHQLGRQMLENMQAAVAKPQQSVFQTTVMAALIFTSGTLAGALTIRGFNDVPPGFSGINKGIYGLQVSVKQHLKSHDKLLIELTEALNRVIKDEAVPGTEATSERIETDTLEQQSPNSKPGPELETEPVTTGSLDKPDSRFTRKEYSPSPLALPLLIPPLSIEEPQQASAGSESVFDQQVITLQENLLALGFDLGLTQADGFVGVQTQQAIDEYRLLYVPGDDPEEAPDDDQLAALIKASADLVREDSKKFEVDRAVLVAIRMASIRTGVDFPFLMELAAIESSFDPSAYALKSSAAGLYQFKRGTWLEAVKTHGDKYGIGIYALQVEHIVTSKGELQPIIHDPVYQHVLDLRYNPRVSALLAAEHVKVNMRRLLSSLDRDPGRTDLYLMHFFGTSGAILFLKALEEHPDKIAGDIFPGPAQRNKNIFRMQGSKPRTIAEVYEVFNRKFNTSRYKDGDAG